MELIFTHRWWEKKSWTKHKGSFTGWCSCLPVIILFWKMDPWEEGVSPAVAGGLTELTCVIQFTFALPVQSHCLLLSVTDWRTTYPRGFCLTRSPTKGNEEASIHKANTFCICSVCRDLCEGILIQISSSKGRALKKRKHWSCSTTPSPLCTQSSTYGAGADGLGEASGFIFSGVGFKGSSHCIQISLLAGGIWLDWLLRTDFILWGAV